MGRSRYPERKAARLRGEPPKSRTHEPAPWYTFRIPGPGNPENVIDDGRQRIERELTDFGIRLKKLENARRERAALIAAGILPEIVDETERPARVRLAA